VEKREAMITNLVVSDQGRAMARRESLESLVTDLRGLASTFVELTAKGSAVFRLQDTN